MKSGEQEGLSEKIETEMEKGGNEKIKVKYFKYEIGMKKKYIWKLVNGFFFHFCKNTNLSPVWEFFKM